MIFVRFSVRSIVVQCHIAQSVKFVVQCRQYGSALMGDGIVCRHFFTEKLAYGIAKRLPENQAFLTNLQEEEVTLAADVYLVGFGINNGTVPLKVMDALDRLAGKKIFLFVTCGIEPSEEYKRLIERKIEPFLPDECDYCGILLCRGQIAEEVLSKIQRQFAQQPDDPAIKKMISEAKLSEGHPDETDAENAVRFIREKLDSF